MEILSKVYKSMEILSFIVPGRDLKYIEKMKRKKEKMKRIMPLTLKMMSLISRTSILIKVQSGRIKI